MFQIKILLHSGFRPHIDACVRCQKKIHGQGRFSLRLGGLICVQCPTIETTFSVISQGTVASMLYIEDNSWDQCSRLNLTKKVQSELKFLLNNFLTYHLEKRLKTTQYL